MVDCDSYPTSYEIVMILKAVSKANVQVDFRPLYEFLLKRVNEHEKYFNVKSSIHLLYTVITTRKYTLPIVDKLIGIARTLNLKEWSDTCIEMRSLKFIEIYIRLQLSQLFPNLSEDSLQFLANVRDFRYYDPSINHNTVLSYQVAHFLSKHNFPCKKEMVGPYALKLCDRQKRIAFECLEFINFFPSTRILKFFTKKKIEHLQLLGWKVFVIPYFKWNKLREYERKAMYVRRLLLNNKLIEFKI